MKRSYVISLRQYYLDQVERFVSFRKHLSPNPLGHPQDYYSVMFKSAL